MRNEKLRQKKLAKKKARIKDFKKKKNIIRAWLRQRRNNLKLKNPPVVFPQSRKYKIISNEQKNGTTKKPDNKKG